MNHLKNKKVLLNKKIILENKVLINILKKTYDLTIDNLAYLFKNEYNGYEKCDDNTLNPLIWELGHITLFYDYHLLKYLYPNNNHPTIFYWKDYDSFLTSKTDRRLIKKDTCLRRHI